MEHKFKKGDILKHKASGEKCIVIRSVEWDFGDFYDLSFGNTIEKPVDIEKVETLYELEVTPDNNK